MNSLLLGVFGLSLIFLGSTNIARASTYGSGNYGACSYQTDCTISISSSGVVNLALASSGSMICSSANDGVTVTTDSATGYVLQLSDSDSDTSLKNGASSITAGSGSFASPSVLGTNKWGYRIDAAGGFGAGPMTTLTNVTSLGGTFAGVPVSTSPVAIKTATMSTTNDTTDIWYGACVDTSLSAGSYTGSVVYTAVSN